MVRCFLKDDPPATDTIRAYYKYRLSGKSEFVSVGIYKATRTSAGLSLSECREKARELSLLRREYPDLKRYLADQQAEQEQQARLRQEELEKQKRQGTLAEMVASYIEDMKRRGKKSHRQTELALNKHVLTPFPDLANKKANLITP